MLGIGSLNDIPMIGKGRRLRNGSLQSHVRRRAPPGYVVPIGFQVKLAVRMTKPIQEVACLKIRLAIDPLVALDISKRATTAALQHIVDQLIFAVPEARLV